MFPSQLPAAGSLPAVLTAAQLPAEVVLRVPQHGRPLIVLLRHRPGLLPGRLLRPARQRPQSGGHVLLHPQPCRPLVDEVDGLVGQEPVGQIPAGQLHRRRQRPVGDGQSVVLLVLPPQALQNVQRLLRGGLRHPDGLEPPLQRRVLFDILAVLLQRGGPHHLDLPPAQSGLEDVGRVDGALRRTGAHNVVQLVQKEDDVARPAHLAQHQIHPVLELAPVLGARHHGGEVQGQQPLAPQGLWHPAGGDAKGQSLRHRRLPHPRLADEAGVVLGAAGQNLDDPAHLLLPAHQRVQLSLMGQPGQVPGIAVGDPGLGPLSGAALLPLPAGGLPVLSGRRLLPLHSEPRPQAAEKPNAFHSVLLLFTYGKDGKLCPDLYRNAEENWILQF